MIGGHDTAINVIILSEYFEAMSCNVKVMCIPKDINGELKVKSYISVPVGFDSGTCSCSLRDRVTYVSVYTCLQICIIEINTCLNKFILFEI